jgi:hypothetical protein
MKRAGNRIAGLFLPDGFSSAAANSMYRYGSPIMTASPPTSRALDAEPSKPARRRTLRRIAVAVSIVTAILLSVNAFVCATWSHFFAVPGWGVWQAAPGLLTVAFIGATLLGFRHSNLFLRLVYRVSATWLGLLNFAFFAAAACWIVAGLSGLAGWAVPRADIATVLFGAAFVTAIYGVINAAWLRVTRVTVHLPNLPEAWQGREVALVTDLHLGHLHGPGFVRRITARLASLRPEAVLISGDLFDGTTARLDWLVAPWKKFSAPKGIFYVTGNHDEFADRTVHIAAAKRAGLRVLHNEKVTVDGLQIIGVLDSEAGEADELRGILRAARIDPRQPGILLAHQPVNLDIAAQEGVSLQLSGHTHRGQIWPWTLLVRRIFGPFAYGLSRLGPLQVYTSSGVGTWGPPLRVGTRSEIVLLRLEKA